MDVQAITTNPILTTQPITQAAPGASFLDVSTPTPAFDVSLTPQATAVASTVDNQAATVDLQAEDATAQAELAFQAQQTVVSALRSGAADVANLLSGLPPGATANLLGGGWARVPQGTDPVEAEAVWAFHFPFRRRDIPAVTGSTRTDAARDKDKQAAKEEPLSGYGPHGEKESVPGLADGTTLDILD